ncbi:MAG: hypothetical protein R3A11_01685 [Bdellovibrionota bacterium]
MSSEQTIRKKKRIFSLFWFFAAIVFVVVSWAMSDGSMPRISQTKSTPPSTDFTQHVFELVESSADQEPSKQSSSQTAVIETKPAAATEPASSDKVSSAWKTSSKPSMGSVDFQDNPSEFSLSSVAAQEKKKSSSKDQKGSSLGQGAVEYSLSDMPLSTQEKENIVKQTVVDSMIQSNPKLAPFFYPYRDSSNSADHDSEKSSSNKEKVGIVASHQNVPSPKPVPNSFIYRSSSARSSSSSASEEVEGNTEREDAQTEEVVLPDAIISVPDVFSDISKHWQVWIGSTLGPEASVGQVSTQSFFEDAGFGTKVTKVFRSLALAPEWNTSWFRKMKTHFEMISQAKQKYLFSFGANGSLMLKVQDGYIANHAGPDLYIQSNPFCYVKDEEKEKSIAHDTTIFFDEVKPEDFDSDQFLDNYISSRRFDMDDIRCVLELARVWVSETGKRDDWFLFSQCSPDNIRQCAGLRPNMWYFNDKSPRTGDPFDVSQASSDRSEPLERIRFVKIESLGNVMYDLDYIGFEPSRFVKDDKKKGDSS